MKSLSTLIKLANQRVNNQRLRLTEFEKKNAELEQEMTILRENLKFEADRARTDPILTLHYGRYAQGVDQQLAQLKITHEENRKRLIREQDRLALLFKEQKVLEVYQTQQQKKATQEKDARDLRAMDEIAARMRQRKNG